MGFEKAANGTLYCKYQMNSLCKVPPMLSGWRYNLWTHKQGCEGFSKRYSICLCSYLWPCLLLWPLGVWPVHCQAVFGVRWNLLWSLLQGHSQGPRLREEAWPVQALSLPQPLEPFRRRLPFFLHLHHEAASQVAQQLAKNLEQHCRRHHVPGHVATANHHKHR